MNKLLERLRRRKKIRSGGVPIQQPGEIEDPTVHRTIDEIKGARAPRNPSQQLITRTEPTATELIASAGTSVPALASAMTKIAERFEASVRASDQLNRALGEFKESAIKPLREELRQMRYNMGDRLTHASQDLEVYVAKLDQVLWGALRAQGMSDAQIRSFRTESGMQPEAPKGFELVAHLAELEALRESNARLIAQNQRLLAQAEGLHRFTRTDEQWTWRQDCSCSLCKAEYEKRVRMQEEVTRVP